MHPVDAYRDGYLPVGECAARMNVTVDRVLDFARRRVLRLP